MLLLPQQNQKSHPGAMKVFFVAYIHFCMFEKENNIYIITDEREKEREKREKKPKRRQKRKKKYNC